MADRKISILATLQDGLSRPARVIQRNLAGMEKQARRLSASLSPLNNKLSTLATGLAGVAAGKKSLDLARQQVEAEAQLLDALSGRRKELERIKGISSDIQSRTKIGDEQLISTAALLINMGVAVENIDKGLIATTDTASAIGLELEGVAKSIGLIASAGRAGELGERLPFLQQMLDDGRDVNDILDEMIRRFGGAAEAVANTEFGKFTKNINLINDGLEKVGSVLIGFINPLVDAAREKFEAFIEIISTDRAQIWLGFFQSLVPFLAKILFIVGALGGVGLLLQAVFFALGPIVSIVGSLVGLVISAVNPTTIVAGLVLLVLQRLGALDGVLDKIKSTALSIFRALTGNAFERLFELFDKIQAGEADVQDLAGLIKLELRQISSRIDIEIFEPIRYFFRSIRLTAGGFVDYLIESMTAGVFLISVLFVKTVDKVVSGLNKLFGFLGVKVESDLTGSLESLEEALRLSAVAVADAESRINKGLEQSFSDYLAEIGKKKKTLDEEIAEAELFVSGAAGRKLKRDLTQLDKTLETQENRFLGFALATEQALERARSVPFSATDLLRDLSPSNIRNALDGLSAESQGALRTSIQQELEQRLQRSEISAQEFLQARLALETEISTSKLKALDAQIERQAQLQKSQELTTEHTEKALEGAKSTLRAYLASNRSAEEQQKAVAQVALLSEGVADGKAKEKALADDLVKLEQRRADLELKRLQQSQLTSGLRGELAERVITELEEARKELEDRRKEISSQVLSGDILDTTAIELGSNALDKFNSKVDKLEQDLIALRAPATETEQALVAAATALSALGVKLETPMEQARAQLDTYLDKLKEVKKEANSGQEVGGFFNTLGGSIKTTLNTLGSLEENAKRIGQTLIQSFGTGLTNALFDAGTSFKDFASSFLLQIAKMITQMIIFRSLSKAIGFFSTGSGDALSGSDLAAATVGGATGGLFTGNSFLHFAKGGRVPGPPVKRDMVNAKLMPGEFVQTVSAAKYYGYDVMEAMRRKLIPKSLLRGLVASPSMIGMKANFAEGGPVGAAAASNGVSQGYIVSSNQQVDRFLRGGSRGFFGFQRQNRAAFRQPKNL